MRTTKPIATISFNTPAYLQLKLNELLKAGRLSFWAFIQHKPEDDEGTNKYHCHVYVEPSKMLQTDDLRSALKEYDPEHLDKPLGCLVWRSSKFDDWYLYGLHNSRYLAMKNQSRRFHYRHSDFVTSDDDELLCLARSIDLLSISPYADMEDAMESGLTWEEYFARGTVPIPLIRSFHQAWFTLAARVTDRGSRTGHPNSVELEEYEQEEIIFPC